MNPSDRWRMEHMLDALSTAIRFIKDRSRDDLDTSEMLVFALMRALEIVGEAASKVSSDGRAEFPDLPWPLMIGMRNRLVHAYFDVDIDTLWETVTEAAPPVAKRLAEILAK